MRNKLKMLIAEDSKISEIVRDYFQDRFDLTVATTGTGAFLAVDKATGFDVGVVDVVMPVENESFTLDDAERTGLRLIKHLLDTEKCSRFAVLTVLWDVDPEVAALVEGRGTYRVVRKDGRFQLEDLHAAVADLCNERKEHP